MTDTPTVVTARPAATTPDRAPGWRERLTGDWGRTFVALFAWHGVLTLVAYLYQGAFPTYPDGTPFEVIGRDLTPLSHTFRWDSLHFGMIADGGYDNPAAPWLPAFYPFFPFCVWLVQTVTFGQLGFLAAGLVVNFTASWLAATALLKVTRHFVDREWAAWLAVVGFLTAPTAFIMHSFYSEAVFCALGFWAYLFALRRQWVFMALCLVPLTATRVTAALFIGLCALEFLRSKDWKLRGLLSWQVLLFPASYLGFAGYVLFLKITIGDPLGMFHAYETVPAWGYHVLNPNFLETIFRQAEVSARYLADESLNMYSLNSHIMPMTSLFVMVVASGYLLWRLRSKAVPLAAFGAASLVMLTLNNNVVSVHRYVLPLLVVYVAMAVAAEHSAKLKHVAHGLVLTHTFLQAILFMLFVTGAWAV